MSDLTPEQRVELVISERVQGLWARWYASGDGEYSSDPARGQPVRFRGFTVFRNAAGETVKKPLLREDIRELAEHIYKEHRG